MYWYKIGIQNYLFRFPTSFLTRRGGGGGEEGQKHQREEGQKHRGFVLFVIHICID